VGDCVCMARECTHHAHETHAFVLTEAPSHTSSTSTNPNATRYIIKRTRHCTTNCALIVPAATEVASGVRECVRESASQ
jgi:hypothetical protein